MNLYYSCLKLSKRCALTIVLGRQQITITIGNTVLTTSPSTNRRICIFDQPHDRYIHTSTSQTLLRWLQRQQNVRSGIRASVQSAYSHESPGVGQPVMRPKSISGLVCRGLTLLSIQFRSYHAFKDSILALHTC